MEQVRKSSEMKQELGKEKKRQESRIRKISERDRILNKSLHRFIKELLTV